MKKRVWSHKNCLLKFFFWDVHLNAITFFKPVPRDFEQKTYIRKTHTRTWSRIAIFFSYFFFGSVTFNLKKKKKISESFTNDKFFFFGAVVFQLDFFFSFLHRHTLEFKIFCFHHLFFLRFFLISKEVSMKVPIWEKYLFFTDTEDKTIFFSLTTHTQKTSFIITEIFFSKNSRHVLFLRVKRTKNNLVYTYSSKMIKKILSESNRE